MQSGPDTSEARAMLRKRLRPGMTFSARYRRRTGQWLILVREPGQKPRHFTGTSEASALVKASEGV